MMLLSVQGRGALYTAILFLLCIVIVHAVKLVRLGYRSLHKKLPPQPPEQKQTAREPVYYLVERKKKRLKPEYSEPKRIQFK